MEKKKLVTVNFEHPEIMKLTLAWCDQMPYMAIWDKQKLAKDIALCVNKLHRNLVKLETHINNSTPINVKLYGKSTKTKRKAKTAKKR
jgi:hypothetical protein